MEFYRSERYKRISSFIRKRKPLFDLTNALSLLKSDSKLLEAKSSGTSSCDLSSFARCSSRSIGSSGDENTLDRRILASASRSEEISSSSSVAHAANVKKSKYPRVEMQQRRVEKGKEMVTALALNPAMTRTNIGQGGDFALPATNSVPYQKARKENSYRVRKEEACELPMEFIEKQKAYFAEIDAFELPEEEISESELE